MAKHTYSNAMRRGVFPHEGGYVNHPRDPGGETNFGITKAVAVQNGYRGDMRAIPKETAEAIYRTRYAAPLRYDDLPAGVDYCVLDYGINSGIGRSGKVLRRVLGLPDNTSAVNEAVVSVCSDRDPKVVINAICDERLRFLKSLRTWDTFGKGWERRVREVRAMSLAMVNEAQASPPVVTNAPAQGKGELPPPTGTQAGTAGGVVVAGGTAATQAAASGVRPWVVVMIVIAAVLVAGLAAYAIKKRRDKLQEA